MNFSALFLSLLGLLQLAIGDRFVRQHAVQQNSCLTPLRDWGTCVSLNQCPEVVRLFTQLSVDRAKQYSMELQRICGFKTTYDNYPVVCCTHALSAITTPRTVFVSLPPIPITTPTTTTSTTTESAFLNNLFNPKDRTSNDLSSTEDPCTGPTSERGFCRPLLNCTQLLQRLQREHEDETYLAYLRQSHSICGSTEQKVCCPSGNGAVRQRLPDAQSNEMPRSLPTEDEGCGVTKDTPFNKVVGGQESQIGAWPWMALIGYDPYSTQPFRCGGALITSRHVLTAAHCLRSDLSFVRLGEHDLSIETETKHVDIDVIKSERHPDFGIDGRHDIAVLLLAKKVEFNEFITPICLPISSRLRAKSYVQHKPFVAGWGKTAEGSNGENSHVLQEVQIPILNNSNCQTIYERHRRIKSTQQFDSSVLCAGHLAGGIDTCQGDSGGPLMISELYKGFYRFYAIGVVSYGIGCARVGIPGVYTSTQHFIDWIADKVAEM